MLYNIDHYTDFCAYDYKNGYDYGYGVECIDRSDGKVVYLIDNVPYMIYPNSDGTYVITSQITRTYVTVDDMGFNTLRRAIDDINERDERCEDPDILRNRQQDRTQELSRREMELLKREEVLRQKEEALTSKPLRWGPVTRELDI
jgi:hypothetical protein